MPAIYFRAFRTRGVYANMTAFRRVVGEGMTQTVFPKLKVRLEAKVKHWKIEVPVLLTKILNEKGIAVKAFPSGPGVKYWKWASYGTKEHTVRVKKTRTMRFWRFKRYKPALVIPHRQALRGLGPIPFSPRTARFRYQIKVPAVPGQFFEKQVAKEYNQEFRKDMENIVRRAVRAAQKEGD